jgi:hypothetical protein
MSSTHYEAPRYADFLASYYIRTGSGTESNRLDVKTSHSSVVQSCSGTRRGVDRWRNAKRNTAS